MYITYKIGDMTMNKQHPLKDTFLSLKGNPKACVYTEPLFGIPYNLYAPYASLYMYALGVNDRQIGLIASIGLVFQILFSLLGGVITDKLGRRRTTFIFDIISWSIPCFILAISQSFIYFLAAAIFSSALRVTMNSWNCLLVEDCDKERIVTIYTLINIAALGTAFVAPLSGLLVGSFGLVPAMRFIYLAALVLFTTKFILLYKFSSETEQGVIRMEATKHQSMLKALSGYGTVFKQILSTPETMLTLGLMLIMSIVTLINSTFWPIMLTENLKISERAIGIFPFLRSVIMMIFFFTVVPRLSAARFKKPLFFAFFIFLLGQAILISAPAKGYLLIIISILLETTSLSLISPLLDSLQVVMVDPKERARIIAVLYVIVLAMTSPFGWIAGTLSSIDRRLPFMLNITLLFLGIILTYLASRSAKKKMTLSA
jgi:MFS family permease